MSQIQYEEQIGGAILHLKGQFIGGDETEQLRNHLRTISESPKNTLIVNLEKTTYLNSTSLGILIAGHTTFVKKEGKLVLCNVAKSIENLFVITKLTSVFPIYESLDEAIKSIS